MLTFACSICRPPCINANWCPLIHTCSTVETVVATITLCRWNTTQRIVSLLISDVFHNPDVTMPTRYPLKREVESCNNRRLNALISPQHTYCSMDRAGYDVQHKPITRDSANQLLDRMIAVSTITLKVKTYLLWQHRWYL
jgi:hypothetical protein